jgi:hypothetical protein
MATANIGTFRAGRGASVPGFLEFQPVTNPASASAFTGGAHRKPW